MTAPIISAIWAGHAAAALAAAKRVRGYLPVPEMVDST
jgi:hypothetical protein